MAVVYVAATLIVIVAEWNRLPAAFGAIFEGAFTGTAATGGFLGSTIIMTMIWGVRRGLFSNEAGQGSAPIAHAAAKTKYPADEGVVSLLEPFIDTIVICTMTALMIIVTDTWQEGNKGVGMTVDAMNKGLHIFGVDGMGATLFRSVCCFLLFQRSSVGRIMGQELLFFFLAKNQSSHIFMCTAFLCFLAPCGGLILSGILWIWSSPL